MLTRPQSRKPRKAASHRRVAAVDRAIAVLRAFTMSDNSLSLAQLADRTGFYKSTILRLTGSLEHGALLLRLDDGSWRLGPLASQLGAIHAASYALTDILEPVFRDLVAAIGESASFNVRQGNVRVCVYRVESRFAVREHAFQGQVLPLDRGAGGRIFLAFDGATGTEYEKIRKNLVITLTGDRVREIVGIASPVFGPRGELKGSISMSIPISRFSKSHTQKFEAAIKKAAARLTQSFGGDPTLFGRAASAQARISREAPVAGAGEAV